MYYEERTQEYKGQSNRDMDNNISYRTKITAQDNIHVTPETSTHLESLL